MSSSMSTCQAERGWLARSLRSASIAAAVAMAAVTLPAVSGASPVTPPPTPPVPVCGIWGCTDESPILGIPMPAAPSEPATPEGGWSWESPPPQSETLAWADFDNDSIVNWSDNCFVVPNPDQAPAIAPTDGSVPVNQSAHDLATEWKSENPGAMYRTAAQLGEACSSYNENWRLTYQAFRASNHERKTDIFRFLGDGGPMFGADTLMLSVPTCSTLPNLLSILELALRLPVGSVSGALKSTVPTEVTDHLSCNGPLMKFLEDVGMLAWAGKHLYTPENGEIGAITNRFLPIPTELPQMQLLVQAMPWLFPGGTGQTVQGQVRPNSPSTIDGKDGIALDWRAVSDAGIGLEGNRYPVTDQSLTDLLNIIKGLGAVAGPGSDGTILRALPLAIGDAVKSIPQLNDLDADYLVYDNCRAAQEGIWFCTVQLGAQRAADGVNTAVDVGWMPFEALDPSIANHFTWEATHPADTQSARYGLPPALGIDN
ncbi:thrombospondin type 3 repeat-containing protein [Rhodococcus erythropolis]|uniref:thrombospondin type 3 repeat-containing protein n=1 Tax=Rhodococcus erythropolis TaxID=1833 RepID=UPI00210D6149|nr:thrombospondin type 3 repeat-containing protein [Rhodococcus erythropolis]MCQ4129041.1 thrombospondin type 3 repeat-containing protein [Rhodococcus erythropolis]